MGGIAETLDDVEITICANGFLVHPPRAIGSGASAYPPEKWFVFQTAAALATWIEKRGRETERVRDLAKRVREGAK